jgi:hypothetical protein
LPWAIRSRILGCSGVPMRALISVGLAARFVSLIGCRIRVPVGGRFRSGGADSGCLACSKGRGGVRIKTSAAYGVGSIGDTSPQNGCCCAGKLQ